MPGFGVPTEQLFNQGSSLTIQELTAPAPGTSGRSLILLGPSLPFMGAEWAGESNVITTWYPGNAIEATQQVLGPRELPSTWEGSWTRTLMGKAPSVFVDETGSSNLIISPMKLREILDDFRIAGSRLRVTWAVVGRSSAGSPGSGTNTLVNDDVRIVREGRIKTFRTPIDRHTDLRWTCEFHWMSRGGRQEKAIDVREDNDLASASNNVQASVNATVALSKKRLNTLKNIRKGASRLTLGQLENLASAPQALLNTYLRKMQQTVNVYKRIGDIANKIRSTPAALQSSLIDFAHNTVAVSSSFVSDLSRRPAESYSLSRKTRDLLRATKFFSNLTIQGQLNERAANELERRLRRTVVAGPNRGTLSVRASGVTRAGDIIAVHVAKAGDTPQTLSMRYYKSSDHGVDILRANRKPWHTPAFVKGDILIIPVLSGATSGTT